MTQSSAESEVAAVQELLAEDGSFAEMAERAVEVGASQLGVDHGHVTRIVPELDHWEVVASTDDSSGPAPVGLVVDLQTTFCRHAIDDDETLALSDVSAEGFGDDIAYETYGWDCYATTPVRLNGELYGTLCFADQSPRPETFDEREVTMVNCLADLLERELSVREAELELDSRNQLLRIFSRVLRHNLRNDMAVIQGHIDLLLEQVDTSQAEPDRLRANVDRVLSLAEKSRQLNRIAQEDPGFQEISVTERLETLTTELEAEHPEARFHTDLPDEVEITALPTLRTALAELLENAVEHGGEKPVCTVAVAQSPETVQINVADSGPGLPAEERRVLRGEPETALDHGQGVGLWIVYWVVNNHDGTIETSIAEDGTTITITLPRPTANERLIEMPGEH